MTLIGGRWSRLAIACAAIFSAGVPSAQATQFTVDSVNDTIDSAPGNGVCADSLGACTLRAAVQEANALPGNDAITLPVGTVTLSLAGSGDDLGSSGDLDIHSVVDITGAGMFATRIDAAALDRVFDVHADGSLHLTDLTLNNGLANTITAGSEDRSGGGLLVRAGATAVLQQVAVRGNQALRTGAGIGLFGSLQGTQLKLEQNHAEGSSEGGALYIGATATTLQLEECTLVDNSARAGGAVYSDGSTTIIGFERCLIARNEAFVGAGIVANLGASHWLLRNSTLSGNHAIGDGGAIFADGQNQLRLENSTITDNRADGSNGGSAIFDVRGSSSANFTAIRLTNTIVAGNTLANGRECNTVFPDVIVSGGATLHGTGIACRMTAGVGDIGVANARLLPLADNGGATPTHASRFDSAAIDAGLDASCTDRDQRGHLRPLDGDGDGQARCDIGAFEFSDAIFATGFE
ncbi:MAG: choice-of-anchor Q domain-containing protein [Tahibacter sp.]